MELIPIAEIAKEKPKEVVLLFKKGSSDIRITLAECMYYDTPTAWTHYCIAPEFPKERTKFEMYLDSLLDKPDSDCKLLYLNGSENPYYIIGGVFEIAKHFFKVGQSVGPD